MVRPRTAALQSAAAHAAALALGLSLVLIPLAAAAAEGDAIEAFTNIEEALDSLREEHAPDTESQTASEVIAEFFPETVVDEGTFPLSEFTENDFDLLRGDPAELTHSGRFYTKFSKDNISGVEKWEKELELFLAYKNLHTYFRFSDVNAFAYNNDPMRFEKAQIRYDIEETGTQITAGSFGELFGRGLAVNMFEERFLDFDNEVEGLKIEQDIEGDGELTLLHGSRKARSEPRHSEITALRYATPLGDAVDVGAHVARVEFPDAGISSTTPVVLKYDLIGADAQIRAGDFRLFAETVRLQRDPEAAASSQFDVDGADGTGDYIAATYSVPGFAATLEYKDYKGIAQPFSVLPPVRNWPEKRQADALDDRGYGLDLNWTPGSDGAYLNAHFGEDNDHSGSLPYKEQLFTYGGPTDKRTTYVLEYWRVNNEGELHDQKRVTLNHKLTEDWTLGSFIEKERRNLFGLSADDWVYELDASFKSEWILVLTRETTSPPGSDGKDNWMLYEVKYRPDDDQEFNLVVGSRREAFVCSGGICRLEPAFDGVRVDYLLRF